MGWKGGKSNDVPPEENNGEHPEACVSKRKWSRPSRLLCLLGEVT